MVTLGDEGWFCSGGDGSYAYSCAEGVDFEANLQVSTLDYGTFHQYPDQCKDPQKHASCPYTLLSVMSRTAAVSETVPYSVRAYRNSDYNRASNTPFHLTQAISIPS